MRYLINNLKSDFFGSYRMIDIMKKNNKEEDELFFSIERRDEYGNYIPRKEYGYLKKTPEMNQFLHDEFFTGCNRVQFIQWEDKWNVVFDEASIIGGISFKMSFAEFDKVFDRQLS